MLLVAIRMTQNHPTAPFNTSEFIKVVRLSESHAKQLRRIYQRLGWKTRDWSGHIWAAPQDSANIHVGASLLPDGDAGAFTNTVLRSQAVRYRAGLAPKELGFGQGYYRSLASRLDDLPIWKAFYHANLPLLASPTEQSFAFLAKDFIPWFLAKFPAGRVDFVEPTGPFWPRMHAIRKLFQIDHDPSVALANPGPPATLAQLHGFDTLYWPSDEISIWCSQSWPYVIAIPMLLSTCCLVFHLGQVWDVREAHPSSIERWWRNDLLFAEKDDSPETLQRILNRQSPPSAFDDFEPILEHASTPAAFAHYLSRISRLRALIADFRLGAPSTSRVPSYETNLQLLLTVQRVIASTHYLTSYEPPFLAKGLLFDVADEYAAMAEPRDSEQAAFFEWLFDSNHGGRWVCDALRKIPTVGDYWSRKANWLYRLLDESIASGVHGSPTTSHPHLVRILRNARHGYWLRGDDLSQHLANYDGNLTDFAPALSVLWWFAFLEEPWQLMRRDVDPLLVRAYA
jgi:hypothetical protein